MSETWEYGEDRDLVPEGFPWPPPDDGPILAAFGAAWKGATFDPGNFFRQTPRDGGTGAALIYFLAIGILLAGATLFWDSMSFFAGTGAQETLAAEWGYPTVSPMVRFLLAPGLLLLSLFVSAGVVHVLLLIFDGAAGGFGTTVRVFCYGYSPAIFGVVPILGTLVGSIWSVVVVIIGLREAHQADAWKPVVAVLVPFVGLLVLFFLAILFVFAVGAAAGMPGG